MTGITDTTTRDTTMSKANRTEATLNLFRNGKRTKQQTIDSLYYLKDWAAIEVQNASTIAYGMRWKAEYEAAKEALRVLLSSPSVVA